MKTKQNIKIKTNTSNWCYQVSLTLDLRLRKQENGAYCVRFAEEFERVLVVEDDAFDAMDDSLIALTTCKFCNVYLKKEMKKVM